MIGGHKAPRRALLLIAVVTVLLALGAAACSSSDAGDPTTSNTTIAVTTTAPLPVGCDGVTGCFRSRRSLTQRTVGAAIGLPDQSVGLCLAAPVARRCGAAAPSMARR